jgi:hypothetical protein
MYRTAGRELEIRPRSPRRGDASEAFHPWATDVDEQLTHAVDKGVIEASGPCLVIDIQAVEVGPIR